MLYHWSVNAHALQTCTLSHDGGDESRSRKTSQGCCVVTGYGCRVTCKITETGIRQSAAGRTIAHILHQRFSSHFHSLFWPKKKTSTHIAPERVLRSEGRVSVSECGHAVYTSPPPRLSYSPRINTVPSATNWHIGVVWRV